MPINQSNIFTQIPKQLKEEFFEELCTNEKVKIQRIVSYGHTTKEFEWYDQNTNEWVILLQGGAVLSFEDEDDINLQPGDYLNIPAHKKHRVSWTQANEKTIWLAVHY